MFEGIVQSLIKKLLGEYIETTNNKDIDVGLLSGQVKVKHLKFKEDVFQKMGWPLRIIFGEISNLYLKIPWKNLSSSPVVVEIDGINVLTKLLSEGKFN